MFSGEEERKSPRFKGDDEGPGRNSFFNGDGEQLLDRWRRRTIDAELFAVECDKRMLWLLMLVLVLQPIMLLPLLLFFVSLSQC